MSEYRFYLYHRDYGKWKRIKDPNGWDGLGRTIKRFGIENTPGIKWHGMFYEYTAKIRLHKDGKDFVQFYKEKYDIEQEILLKIDKRNTATRQFEQEYVGKLDLSVYKIGTIYLDTRVENIGFIQKIKNALDTKVDLSQLTSKSGTAITPFSNETHTIDMHSKVLRKLFRQAGNESASQDGLAAGTYYFMFNTTLQGAAPSAVALYVDEIDERLNMPTQISTLEPVGVLKYAFKMKEGGSATFKYDIGFTFTDHLSGTHDWTVQWKLVYGKAGSYTTVNIGSVYNSTSVSAGGERSLETTVTLAAGDEIYRFAEVTFTGSDIDATFLANSISVPGNQILETITIESITPVTTCKIVPVFEAFTRVIQSITDSKIPVASEYYGRTDSEPVTYAGDGAGSLRGITNGYQIRGIDRGITCSLRMLVDTFAGIDGIGFGMERINGVERVRIEPLTYWYQQKKAMQLSYVKDIEKETVSGMYYNQIEGGTTKWQNEQVTNLDEPNGKREWSPPITQVKNLLDLKVPAVTSAYTIEFARRLTTEPTKDGRYDDDIFVIQLARDGGDFVPETDEAFSSVTGVISPETMYNLKLSPARCLRNNGRLVRSFLEKQITQSIHFDTGEGNVSMASTLTGETEVDEDANILISDLDRPLFLPEVYSVRVKMTREQLQILNTTDPDAAANVLQFIEFSKTDKGYKRGYLLEAKPASNSNEVNLRLLKANI